MERIVSFGFLAPPTVLITICVVGALIALKWRLTGLAIVLAASLTLFAVATPAVSSWLLRRAEAGVPRQVDFDGAQAIVVLGGEVRRGDGSDIPDRLGAWSYERLSLATDAYRRLHLPVAVTGGRPSGQRISEGALMQAALESKFGIPVAWSEDQSRNTWENAVFTGQLLRKEGIDKVVVVTHRWHLPRALRSFERAGMRAVPWPAPETAPRGARLRDYLPTMSALQDSFHGLHEIIGRFYYELRY
ncbi:MAG: YdcF family protein [Alphaproteobacteria bacterium]